MVMNAMMAVAGVQPVIASRALNLIAALEFGGRK